MREEEKYQRNNNLKWSESEEKSSYYIWQIDPCAFCLCLPRGSSDGVFGVCAPHFTENSQPIY